MEIILPQFGLFFWTALIFLVVFFLLRKFAWKPILQALNDREQQIEDRLQAAAAAEHRMQQLTADNERLLNEARLERDKMLKEATAIRDQLLAEARAKANEEGEKILANARQQIELEKNAAVAQIKAQAADLAILVAEKVLRRKMENRQEDETYIKTLINDVKLN